jgi:hypothetical protein
MGAPTLQLTEADFQRRVLDLAAHTGWRVYHTRDSRGSQPGFPDLVLVSGKQARLLFVELKSSKGRLSTPQRQWLSDLAAARAETAVWRPADWDEVVAVLRGKPVPVPDRKD